MEACVDLMESGFGCNMVESIPHKELVEEPLSKVLQCIFSMARHHSWCMEALHVSNKEYRKGMKHHELPWTDMEFLMDRVASSIFAPFLIKKVSSAR